MNPGLVLAAVGALALVALAALLAGLVVAGRQLRFVRQARRVDGRVASEWRYQRYGRAMRYYRVEFILSTGQRAELRSTVTSSSQRSRVGQAVPVLVRERAGQDPKARIGTALELWFAPAVLLFIGGVATLSVVAAGWRLLG